jgi:hypothetical protein
MQPWKVGYFDADLLMLLCVCVCVCVCMCGKNLCVSVICSESECFFFQQISESEGRNYALVLQECCVSD